MDERRYDIYLDSPWIGRGYSTFFHELGAHSCDADTKYAYLLLAPEELEPTTVGLRRSCGISEFDHLYVRAECLEGAIIRMDPRFNVLYLRKSGHKTSKMLTHYVWSRSWGELQPLFKEVYEQRVDASGTMRRLKKLCGEDLELMGWPIEQDGRGDTD